MLPNFLVIGAQKSATTWLYYRLKEHPEIFLPDTKEIHFFNKYDSDLKEIDRYKYGFRWYESFFSNYKDEKAVGEITPMYLCDEFAPYRIYNWNPEVKLIVILRNPIDRAYSHYWMAKGKKRTNLTFEKIVEMKENIFIERGLYYKQLVRYYELFNSKNILVLTYDELQYNKVKFISEIYNFVGVSSEFDYKGINNRENSSGEIKSIFLHRMIGFSINLFRTKLNMGYVVDYVKKIGLADKIKNYNTRIRNYPEMPLELRNQLKEFYEDDINKLSNLINMDLRHWLK